MSIPHLQISHICRRQMSIPHLQISHICRRQMSIPHLQISHICHRQMSIPHLHLWRGGGRQAGGEVKRTPKRASIPLAIFLTSAVGRCLFPISIYGERVADRPGVRSKR